MVKKLLIFFAMLLLAVYIAVAMGTFSKPPQEARCQAVEINFGEETPLRSLNRDEVLQLLRHHGLDPTGQRLCDIDVQLIENTLRRHPLLKSCECYQNASGKVIIDLQQRVPILHVLNNRGEDFYIDNEGKSFNAPANETLRLPVVTGAVARSEADSLLRGVALYFRDKGAWADSIAQVEVLPDGAFELALAGEDFIIYLGKTQEVSRKMENFAKFYNRALRQIGTDKYSRIDLEFNNQIICTRKSKPGLQIYSTRTAPPPSSTPAPAGNQAADGKKTPATAVQAGNSTQKVPAEKGKSGSTSSEKSQGKSA
ncbi:MAG: cell division protein FtsQ/DivIB [Bacteroidaceae bacterium]|jgi:cell division protein FtsQ